ncbi:hypothetical protein LEP1GSC186_2562 [Leptospira noguchii serovar Autumnalis str. ZUN142]|uniref:Uncharacterized protein n=1 Tax=Leptospira noguchii serovar Autumnalis str. ZUN142 TaxID=1085540 RepID=M6UDT9_9LEPT|nr:hypothetical protein LEP1GSC186_2562 [Leptospira noguchii serovar Autumnalis str. ZUN142]
MRVPTILEFVRKILNCESSHNFRIDLQSSNQTFFRKMNHDQARIGKAPNSVFLSIST